jgi:hypothetical protein
MFIAVNSISPKGVNTFFWILLQTGNVAGSHAKTAGEAAQLLFSDFHLNG